MHAASYKDMTGRDARMLWLSGCKTDGNRDPKGTTMRSELVMGAMKHVPNRFLLTRLSAKAIRAFHRPNTRVADTTNEVLRRLGTENPIEMQPTSLPYDNPELRRAS